MKRPYALIFLMTFLGILAGWGAGSYLSNAGLRAALAAVPASPVVVASKYDQKSKKLALVFSNAGGQPLEILGKAIAFKPKKGDGYEIAYVALDKPLVVPPFSVETLVVQMKASTPELLDGDVVATTIRYAYPDYPGIYDMTHIFTQGQAVRADGKKATASGQDKAAQSSDQQKQ